MRRKPTSSAALRNYRPLAPNCLCVSVVSGFAAHVFNSGQIVSLVLATIAQTAHFPKSPASLPVFLQIGSPTRNPSITNPAVTWNRCRLSCPARAYGVPHPSRLPVTANEPNFYHHDRAGTGFLETSRLGPNKKKAPESALILKLHQRLEHLAQPDLADQALGSDVIQDSDFPWEIAERFFDPAKKSPLPVRQAPYE
jgi:hypothetical protein